jgi:uncharacterized protein
MRSPFRVFSLCVLLLASCRGEGAPAEPGERERPGPASAPVYGATGADNLRIVPVEIEVPEIPPGWSGMRIAAISDLQLGLWEGNAATARAAVARALAERPDVFVLLGDYVMAGSDYRLLDRVLEPLRGQRVLAVLGDRDMAERPEGPDSAQIRIREALERNGVEVLLNSRARVVRGGDTAYIAGVDPFTARRPDWRRAEIWGGIPAAPSTVVVLSHMPVAAATLPVDRFPVVLAGHTFCGRVTVPETPRLQWLNTAVFPGTPEPDRTRIYRIRGATLFVTCGVGYGYVPVRYGAPPEVAIVTLRAVGGAAEAGDAGAEGAEADAADVDSLIRQFTPGDTGRTAAPETAAPPS